MSIILKCLQSLDRWILRLLLGRVVPAIILFLISLWVAAISYFSPALPVNLKGIVSLVIFVFLIWLYLSRKYRIVAFALWLLLIAAVLSFYLQLEPSNNRTWESSVAKMPSTSVKGNLVTIGGIRNFNYRTETDYDRNYSSETFDLNKIASVDLIVSYWSSKHIAHVMTSFGFDDGKYVNISIETRKEATEQYSAIKGFFRNYELIYVVSDERDVIGLRTKFRKPSEKVYLLRLATSRVRARLLFEEFLKEIGQLQKQPDFYDTLLTNCTTQVFWHSHVNNPLLRFNWKVLLSGHVPEYLYEGGALDSTLPFEELMQRSLVNEAANLHLDSAHFSELIRTSVPRPVQRQQDGTK